LRDFSGVGIIQNDYHVDMYIGCV